MDNEIFRERLTEEKYSEMDNKELVQEYNELSAVIQKTVSTF